MGYWNGVWSNLAFNVGDVTKQAAMGYRWMAPKYNQGDLKYVSQSAYKSVLVYAAKRLAMSALEHELNSLMPKYEKWALNKRMENIRKQQKENRQTLIQNGEKSTEGFGYIEIDISNANWTDRDSATNQASVPKKHKVIAKTKYGTPIPEALILSYDLNEDESPIQFTDIHWVSTDDTYSVKKKSTWEQLYNPGTEIQHKPAGKKVITYSTRTVFHIDLAPRVTMNSSKNVILTQVQGRDYSRKELVSGGDMTYSVSGSIVSDEEGVYPTEAVKRFIKIMQHNGIINVNFLTFGLLGVKRIIIKDFSLDAPEYKNIQPYSFTCVAVEPDDVIKLKSDTIATINRELSESPLDKWTKLILDNKLAKMGANAAIGLTTTAATSSLGLGF